MRTWCVSLTMHGTSKSIVHSSLDPVFVLGSGCSLRHLHISIPCVSHVPHSGAAAKPQTLAIPVHPGLHEEAGIHSYSKSKRCPNSECTLRSCINERSFLIFLFEKMSPTWIPKHFQHHTWKHWWMRNNHKSCVSVYSSTQHVCGTESLFKAHARERDHIFRSFTYSDMVPRIIKLLLLPLRLKKKRNKVVVTSWNSWPSLENMCNSCIDPFPCQWKKPFHVYASGGWKSAFLKDKQWI